MQLDQEIKIGHSHRALGPRGTTGDWVKPRVIIAKLHYDVDVDELLRRARDQAPLMYNGKRFAIFPNYTSNVSRAKAAFTFNDQDKEFVDLKKAIEYIQKPRTEAV